MNITLDDQTALRRYARKQDPEAFGVLTDRYQGMVFATCRRALGNDADAEDATQETFLKLARSAGKVRSNAAAWLHACALGTSIDFIRRSATRRSIERRSAASPDAQDPSPASWIELEPVLDDALAKLDEADRELIVARFLAGRSQSEIARQAGVSDGTIHRRTKKALDKLRAHLAASGLAITGTATLTAALAHSSTAVPSTLSLTMAKVGLAGVATSTPPVSAALLVTAAAIAITGVAVTATVITNFGPSPTAGLPAAVAIQQPASDQPLGPPRTRRDIGPFESVSAMDGSFGERGVWISKERVTIAHGSTLEGEPKRANLRILSSTPDPDDPNKVTVQTRVERITPVGDPYSRFKLGQLVEIGVEFDEKQRVVMTPLTEGVQLGRNEPKWFGVRPPLGWPEHARIPDNAGPFDIEGPWTEAERIPVTITPREINFGGENWTERRYRIIEWEQEPGFSRILSINAGGRDPRLIGTRFPLLIREDENGYSIAFFPPGEPRAGEWPSSFDYSPQNPVRVISFKGGD